MTNKRRAEPKRHHYVPQSYLRRFANADDQIVMYRCATGESFQTHPRNAAVEGGLYTCMDEAGAPILIIEDLLAKIDGRAAAIMRTFDDGVFPPTGYDRGDFSLFLAWQLVRTRDARHTWEEYRDFSTKLHLSLNLAVMTPKQRANSFRRMYDREPTTEDMQFFDRMPELLDQVRLPLTSNEYLGTMDRVTREYLVPLLYDMSWHLVRLPERGFLTCDQPVALWRDEAEPDFGMGLGVATADAIFFILDSRQALVLAPVAGGVPAVLDGDPELAERINTAVARHAYEWIFHHPDHNPLNGLQIPTDRSLFNANGVPAERGRSPWLRVRDEILAEAEHGSDHYLVTYVRPRTRSTPQVTPL